ncbi:unnamed protein product [Pieris macdunnoughi]|uniref:Uncharacterized protein n=1 Tax=Pieris macdunnoughi TaxID=345717 RepID=A0A821X2M6_9NEOP|nr:unnamed protein product [Pieris macdunnoughi]
MMDGTRDVSKFSLTSPKGCRLFPVTSLRQEPFITLNSESSLSYVPGGVYKALERLFRLKKLCKYTQVVVTSSALSDLSSIGLRNIRKTTDITPKTFSTILRARESL